MANTDLNKHQIKITGRLNLSGYTPKAIQKIPINLKTYLSNFFDLKIETYKFENRSFEIIDIIDHGLVDDSIKSYIDYINDLNDPDSEDYDEETPDDFFNPDDGTYNGTGRYDYGAPQIVASWNISYLNPVTAKYTLNGKRMKYEGNSNQVYAFWVGMSLFNDAITYQSMDFSAIDDSSLSPINTNIIDLGGIENNFIDYPSDCRYRILLKVNPKSIAGVDSNDESYAAGDHEVLFFEFENELIVKGITDAIRASGSQIEDCILYLSDYMVPITKIEHLVIL